jgi:hypothetical protein
MRVFAHETDIERGERSTDQSAKRGAISTMTPERALDSND